MRRFLITAAAILAAVVFFLLVMLPPLPSATAGSVQPSIAARTVAGAYHVHTTRSDGSADVASVARAAARAGLRFVIFTDHGDGTRAPDAPAYRDGVLCLDGVEISTTGGHYVALGMRASPYPLGGEAAAVVEDVARFGGFGIAAHPDSVRQELAWTDWTAPFDGIEWLSADSEWRNESRARLARVFVDYFVRPGPALASVLDRPTVALARWDAASSRRRVVGLAALDAHGGMRGRMESAPGPRLGIPGVPSYEASFRSFAIRAITAAPFSGRAETDARLLLDAVREGRVFNAIDAVAAPAFLDFHAGDGSARVEMGGLTSDVSVPIRAAAVAPPGATLVLLRDGREIARSPGTALATTAEGPGAYRIEIEVPHAPGTPPVPWIVGNPIYVNPYPPEILMPEVTNTVLDLRDCAWHVEKDPASEATLDAPAGGPVRLSYRLKSGAVASQFVALACDLPTPVPAFDRILFRRRASSPARVSVQLRFDRDPHRRWAHSVYADAVARETSVDVASLVPAERGSGDRPSASRATTLLFVVDLTNAAPGASGRIEVSDVSLAVLAVLRQP